MRYLHSTHHTTPKTTTVGEILDKLKEIAMWHEEEIPSLLMYGAQQGEVTASSTSKDEQSVILFNTHYDFSDDISFNVKEIVESLSNVPRDYTIWIAPQHNSGYCYELVDVVADSDAEQVFLITDLQ